MAALLLLLLPVLAVARIQVEIDGKYGKDQPDMTFYFSGSETDVISEKERETFGLGASDLKDAVRAYFGKRPDDVYVSSPTPWGDLYKSYDWPQVLRSLVPIKGRVLSINSVPQVVMRQVFENNSTKPATFNVGISQTVQNTVSTTWQTSGSMTVGSEISYELGIEIAKAAAKMSMSYTSAWGRSTQKTNTVTIGSSSALQLNLEGGQAVTAELHANKGTINVEIEYEASLAGTVAVNYAKTYKGHHFWGLDVNAIMAAGGLKAERMSKEIIQIGYYSDARIIVHDREIGTKIIDITF